MFHFLSANTLPTLFAGPAPGQIMGAQVLWDNTTKVATIVFVMGSNSSNWPLVRAVFGCRVALLRKTPDIPAVSLPAVRLHTLRKLH